MSSSELWVVIPVRNQPVGFESCILALLEAGVDVGRVVVVDDASTDETAAAAARRMGTRLVRRERRGGPAGARNTGIDAAGSADIILFVDSDVVVAPDVVRRVEAAFRDPAVGAVFGSYDTEPAVTTTVSRYRNLLHHFVHQAASPEASTFWAGCGAVRREALLQVGGFDDAPRWHFIEDIELGTRLVDASWRIHLDKGLFAKHLKHWTLSGMVRTDIMYRARPWTHLLLDRRTMPNDLNVAHAQRGSIVLSAIACLMIPTAPIAPGVALPTAALALLGMVALNVPLFSFFRRVGGTRFAIACLPLQVIHNLCAGLGFAWAMAERWLPGRTRPGGPTKSGMDSQARAGKAARPAGAAGPGIEGRHQERARG